jgi:hypothetical protein
MWLFPKLLCPGLWDSKFIWIFSNDDGTKDMVLWEALILGYIIIMQLKSFSALNHEFLKDRELSY